MKKKTALTLSAIALLSAGVTFGVKFKKKKDFEKTLKTILIPDAEKQLESLLREDASLNDSIDFYHALLLTQSSKADGQRIAEKHNKLLGENNPTIYSDLRKISKTLGLMGEDWSRAKNRLYKQLEPYAIGDGYYDDNDKANKLLESKSYLTDGMTENLARIDAPDIPGGYQQWIGARYNDVYPSFYGWGDFYYYVDVLQSEIKATRGEYKDTYNDRVFYPITSAEEIKELLLAIKFFVNNFDNSRGVINSEYVKQINDQIKALLPQIEKQIKLETSRDNTAKKLKDFKTAKVAVEQRVEQQQKKLHVLKNTEISKLMHEQRNK